MNRRIRVTVQNVSKFLRGHGSRTEIKLPFRERELDYCFGRPV